MRTPNKAEKAVKNDGRGNDERFVLGLAFQGKPLDSGTFGGRVLLERPATIASLRRKGLLEHDKITVAGIAVLAKK